MVIQIKANGCIEGTSIKFEAVCNATARISVNGKIYYSGEGPLVLSGRELFELAIGKRVSIQKVFHPVTYAVFQMLNRNENKVSLSSEAVTKGKFTCKIINGIIRGTSVRFVAIIRDVNSDQPAENYTLANTKLLDALLAKQVEVVSVPHPYVKFLTDALIDPDWELFITCDSKNFFKRREANND